MFRNEFNRIRIFRGTESLGSSLVRDSDCVGTLSKSFAHNCSAITLHLCFACLRKKSYSLQFKARPVNNFEGLLMEMIEFSDDACCWF